MSEARSRNGKAQSGLLAEAENGSGVRFLAPFYCEVVTSLTRDLPAGSTLEADKSDDVKVFVEDLKDRKIEPHVAIDGTVSGAASLRRRRCRRQSCSTRGSRLSMLNLPRRLATTRSRADS